MNIAVVDYGTGNLHSLAKALQAEGATVTIESDLVAATRSNAVVLPGVGAFGAAAAVLASGADTFTDALRAGLPCLGICLGMQLLYESSEESEGAGLGLLEGHARKVRAPRIPQMGWNDVEPLRADALFDGLDEVLVYYANSYVAEPVDDADVLAWTTYAQDRFPAVVRHDNMWGVQFHPEKSGRTGRRMLRNFISAARSS